MRIKFIRSIRQSYLTHRVPRFTYLRNFNLTHKHTFNAATSLAFSVMRGGNRAHIYARRVYSARARQERRSRFNAKVSWRGFSPFTWSNPRSCFATVCVTYPRSAKLTCRRGKSARAWHDGRQAHLVQNNCLLLQLTLGRLRCVHAAYVQFYADLHRGCTHSRHGEMHMERAYTPPRRELLSDYFSTIFWWKSNRKHAFARMRFSYFAWQITNLYYTTFTVPASVMRSCCRIKTAKVTL